MTSKQPEEIQRIAFVGTRIAGTDGVSLEIGKWADILQGMGYDCFYIAGKLDRDGEQSFVIEEADFQHPVIREIDEQAIGTPLRSPALSATLRDVASRIKEKLYAALDRFDIDLIIAQNSLTIPMNIPLGVALVEVVLETGIPCIAHHHDFAWERDRYMVNAVEDYLHAAFPPPLSEIQHVVINARAGEEFSRRTGQPFRVIPNVMDFDHPPPPADEYSVDLRQSLGITDEDLLILQPTRVVHRKGIEHSIELVRRLDDPRCKLVITHSTDDEGAAYGEHIRDFAALMGVEIIFAAGCICATRRTLPDGCKCYSIWDAYPHADLVTYPSTYEGFGNAFLEAVYYKRPIFCNRYTIFRTELEPCGFRAIVMDGFVTGDVVEQVRRVLTDADYREDLVEHNYQVARRYFSYDRVEQQLRIMLAKPRPFACD